MNTYYSINDFATLIHSSVAKIVDLNMSAMLEASQERYLLL